MAYATSLEDDEDGVNVTHDDMPLRYCTINSTLGEQPVLGLMQHDVRAELHLMHDGVTYSFIEVDGDVAWRTVMKLESGDGRRGKELHLGARRSLSWPPSDHPKVGLQAQEKQRRGGRQAQGKASGTRFRPTRGD